MTVLIFLFRYDKIYIYMKLKRFRVLSISISNIILIVNNIILHSTIYFT